VGVYYGLGVSMTVIHKNKLPTVGLIYSGHAYCMLGILNGVGFILFIAGRVYSVLCILPLFGAFLLILDINTVWVVLWVLRFFYLLGEYRGQWASFYQPLSLCFKPWAWAL
jgi:hypothetical protein